VGADNFSHAASFSFTALSSSSLRAIRATDFRNTPMTSASFSSATDSTPPVAGAAANADPAAGSVEFINFAIGNDQYGVDIMSVREIKEWSNVTHLPKQPEYVRGVLNLRGVVVPIIDLRCRFGQGLTDCTPTHIIIIVQMEGRQMGLLADRVLDIVSFEQSAVQPVPTVARSSRARFLAGLVTVEGAMIALIDLVRLLSGEDDEHAMHVLNA
jgi:purine-binding chemotaxis protein CheW